MALHKYRRGWSHSGIWGGGSDRVEWLGDEGVGELENETLGSKDGWGWIRRPELVDIVNEICVIYLLMSDGIVAGCLFHHLFAVIERQRFGIFYQVNY